MTTTQKRVRKPSLTVYAGETNMKWVETQAKKYGVSASTFTDALIGFAKKNKFTLPKPNATVKKTAKKAVKKVAKKTTKKAS